MKNIDLFIISGFGSFIVELFNIYSNYRKPKAERILFDDKLIEFLPIILYPIISIFLAYVLWCDDDCVDKNQINRILALNIGVSCSILITKPLDLIK